MTGLPAKSERLTVLSSSVCRVKSATFLLSFHGEYPRIGRSRVPNRGRQVSIIVEGSERCHRGSISLVDNGAARTGCPTLGVPLFLRHGWGIALTALAFALPAAAQYPGQIANPTTNAPELRAVAVLEWTGDEEHPKTSRLFPSASSTARSSRTQASSSRQPEPLALESDVEYQLPAGRQAHRPLRLSNVRRAAGLMDRLR